MKLIIFDGANEEELGRACKQLKEDGFLFLTKEPKIIDITAEHDPLDEIFAEKHEKMTDLIPKDKSKAWTKELPKREKRKYKKKKERNGHIPRRQVKYTPEILKRLKQVINEKTKSEITDLLRLEFGLNISVDCLNNALFRRGIKCTNKNNKNIQSNKKYTDEHFNWLRENIDDTKNNKELHHKFNKEFDMEITFQAMNVQLSLNGIRRIKVVREKPIKPIELINPHQKEIDEKQKRQRKGMSEEAINIIEENYMEKTDEDLREMIADKIGAYHQTDKIEGYRESNGMARPEGWSPDDYDDLEDDD